MKPNIIELVVDKNRCIGCGTCVAICPANVLHIGFDKTGLYQAFETNGCLEKCSLCINICPFIKTNKNEMEIAKNIYKKQDKINFHKNLGYFIDTYEIHKKDINDRLKSASGGAGHALLENLLDEHIVDLIISIESNNDVDKLFKFTVFKNSQELKNTKGSVYYPVEMSEVLDYVLKNDKTCAITALPCFTKAIRLAQEKNHRLRKRIKFIIGLVCGQMKTKEFTHTLAKNIIGTDRLESVRFRVKQENEPAVNFAFEFIEKKNSKKAIVKWLDYSGPWVLWSSRAFTPNACNNCIDTFNLCADIVLMDAWLPEYIKDYRGHTLVIVRAKEIKNILEGMQGIEIKKINHKKVFLSQKAVVENKKLFFYGSKNLFVSMIKNIKLQIQKLSNEDYEKNINELKLLLLKLKKIEKTYKIISLPKRAILKLGRRLKGI